MGSVNGNDQSNWASYSNYMDCSQGICTIYCTQFCYWLFPPAPAPPESDEDPTPFPPLVIGVIGVLAIVFLLVGCYAIVTRYCKRQPNHAEGEGIEGTAGGRSRGGLDESLIRAIAVCEYRNGDGRVRGGECAVCLGRFQERVALRLLPKCGHAFHLGCIDEWLRSHPSCPLCRADVDPRRPRPASDDLVLTVDGVSGVGGIETRDEEAGNGRFRRSVSLGDFPWWVSTTGVEGGEDESSSARRQVEMKRSASTGGTGGQVMCTVHEGSKIFILPC